MDTEQRKTCAGCRFFDPKEKESKSAECRRYPPTLIQEPDGELENYFPVVLRGQWCGEWVSGR